MTTSTKIKLTLVDHTISAVLARDSAKIQKILDKANDPTLLPFVAHIGAVGSKAHEWAWDQLEEWQWSQERD